jgi:drug/metabolite transporter (DMT)-like permease
VTSGGQDTHAALRRRGQVCMTLAALAWSIAGVMQRGLHVSTATQMAGRAFFAWIALTGVSVLEARRTGVSPVRFFRSIGRTGVILAVSMGTASACFVIALNHASVANVLFIQALAPFVAVVLSWVFLRERASRRTWIATAIAVGGVAVMVGGPHLGSAIGLAAASVMTFLFAVAIVITRHRRDVSMAPAVALSQLIVFVGAIGFAHVGTIRGSDLWRLVVLGLFQMGAGQLFFVIGARLLPASEAALITLLEVVLGPLWVWLGYRENPGAATLVGGAIVLVAVAYQATERAAPAGIDAVVVT